MKKFKVLSTKKITPELVNESRRNNIEITTIEFISIKSIHSKENEELIKNWALTNHIPAVFTSANAVDSFRSYFPPGPINSKNWEVYCLSGKTKESLISNFPGIALPDTDENASELAKKIITKGCHTVVFFCGNKRRDELPSLLKENGIGVQEVVLYETMEKPVELSHHYDAVLFFSPSSVTSFFSVNKMKKNTICFSIGETTANAIREHVTNIIIQSPEPSAEKLIEKLNLYFQQLNKTNE
ncbi:MAG: uroporphyrinogen-III synthase [Flavisolibacter sp.]